ncbi:hypothetical protein HPP92_008163 [Vanilla planifolia]|uniref:Uncharacterized protein n=1 Tax=Vanilla planifolia TaxID=51239 RepID=A0A835PIE7_VANPL|nr:hypothetical protein HPP92_026191 [Vanilla planifolia]KAG0486068.1 hypothetical protein HPP92_008163 [Vanilla planifolia]
MAGENFGKMKSKNRKPMIAEMWLMWRSDCREAEHSRKRLKREMRRCTTEIRTMEKGMAGKEDVSDRGRRMHRARLERETKDEKKAERYDGKKRRVGRRFSARRMRKSCALDSSKENCEYLDRGRRLGSDRELEESPGRRRRALGPSAGRESG